MSKHDHEKTSHENFSHDSLDSLGYDWARVANPRIEPSFPRKIYLPRDTEQIASALRESKQLGEEVKIRSKGHSSNDLVLAADGVVLCTEKLNKIVRIDTEAGTALVQGGVVLAQLDAALALHGMGLPVIGDHNHITAGGFASVGGISPASHRHGMFVDNILELEYVDWEGNVKRCGPQSNLEEFHKVIAGTGRFGVIATLLLRILRIKKRETLLKNDRFMTRKLEDYIQTSHKLIENPGGVLYERGIWLDMPLMGGDMTIGQFSSYQETQSSGWAKLRRNLAYGYLHFLGKIAGRLPKMVDVVVKYLGIIGVVFSPRYGNVSDIESFTDKVLDSSVGDPTRMIVVLAPVESYPQLFRDLNNLCRDFRGRHGCFTFISFYVKAIESAYLKPANGTGKFSELMLYLGMRPDKMPDSLLESFVSRIDDLCVESKALRYMHTLTVKDSERRNKIDPNCLYP